MKVLIVSVGKMLGGVESYTLTLGRILVNSGQEVYYVLRKNSWLDSQVQNNKMTVSMGKNIISDMIKIKEFAENQEIDIVHCNSNNGLFVSVFIKQSKVGVIHGDVFVDQRHKGKFMTLVYSALENWLINNKCTKCITVSDSLKRTLINRGVLEQKLEVIHNGIDLKKYENMPDYFNDEIRICSVGNLLPVKNHIKLLEAIRIVKLRNDNIKIYCDIYGEGTERNNLERYITINDMKYVSLKGYVSEIRDVLNRYQLYIHPSLYESFGIAVLEAMDAGCCVIANSVGGLKEIVKNNCGYLLDCSDEYALADMIEYLHFNRDEIKRVAENGSNLCKEQYSIDMMVDKVIDLYNSIKEVKC